MHKAMLISAIALTLLLSTAARAADSTNSNATTPPSSVQASQEEELYQAWVKEKTPKVFLEYFRRFPQGSHRDAIASDICQQWGFKKIDGAPLLVRFRGYHADSKMKVHDGKSYEGWPPQPVMTDVLAKEGSVYFSAAIEFLALADTRVTMKDLAFRSKESKDSILPNRFNLVGMMAVQGADLEMTLEKMPQVVVEAFWEVKSDQVQEPVVSIFKSQFDLKEMKVEKL